LFARSKKKNSCRVIKIDDHAIMICFIGTALMALTITLFAQIYPLNKPGPLQVISSAPRTVQIQTRAPEKPALDAHLDTRDSAFRPNAALKAQGQASVTSNISATPKEKPVPESSTPIKRQAESVPESPNRLKMIRGGRHALYGSIVFEFARPVKFSAPRLEGSEIRLTLKATTTKLKPFRKYRTFESWVRLNRAAGDLQVRIGITDSFMRFSAFQMKDPQRLVINLYDR
jgi:hypothetical protein